MTKTERLMLDAYAMNYGMDSEQVDAALSESKLEESTSTPADARAAVLVYSDKHYTVAGPMRR